MEKTRFVPADPMEAAQVPTEGVDIPEQDKDSSPRKTDVERPPHNAGLRPFASQPETAADDPAAKAREKASQRGRTG